MKTCLLITICLLSVMISERTYAASPLSLNEKVVEFHTFEAIGIESGVSVRWISKMEKNCSYYTVERSSNGNDYIEITRMDAAGNSGSLVEYLLIDNDPLPGTSYYRLKYTFSDGNYDYSEAIVVIRSTLEEKAEIKSADSTYDFVSEDVILVRDKEGLEYFSKVILVKQEDEIIAFDEEKNIPPGEYYVIASSRNYLRSAKITVK